MDIEFHPDAVSEIREATLYYQAQQVGLGERFLSTIQEALTPISNFPESFPIVFSNVRQCKVTPFPYAIVYRIQVNYIQTIALAHSRRQPQYWSGRSKR
jgi:plasmid stabilization system protein ParE